MLTAVIVAGGSSRRMGFDKTFAKLGDQPVIAHTIAAFERTASVAEIIVVGRQGRLDELGKLLRELGFSKVRDVVAGGEHRQDSVKFGLGLLRESGDEFVAIHDAARPLVTQRQIEDVFAAAREHGAAALATRVADTLKRADEDLFVSGSVDRDHLFAMQTPQIFRRQLIAEAYRRVFSDGVSVTDEVSAVERLGQKVMLVECTEPNFKITYPADLALAALVLRTRVD
jgi:2-C-methyl-D-erythritol 4-phosphate cytidylyltransferase